MEVLPSGVRLSPLKVSPRRSDEPALRETKGRPFVLAAITAAILGLLAFLLIQGILATYNVHVIRDATRQGLIEGYSDSQQLNPRLLAALIGGGISYTFLATVGTAVASRGHRYLFIAPAASFVLVPLLLGSAHHPEPIGGQWRLECFLTCPGPWFAHAWLGPLVDLALVLVPGWIVAMRVQPRRWPGVVDSPAVAAIGVTAAVVAVAGWTIEVVQNSLDLRALVAVGVLGMALGTALPWWPWLHVLFAIFLTGALGWLWEPILYPEPNFTFLDAWPFLVEKTVPMVTVALLASCWRPLAWLLRRLQGQPFHLLVAVNALNLMDAFMTAFAVRSGEAHEANPVVRFVGLPAKVILVGLLTLLLYRRRPSSLVWPAGALLLVACYHFGGILVNGWR